MEEHERIDINPTWELIDFNKATDMIPKKMKDYLTYRGLNPLDESVAVCFNIYDGIYVYYLPSTNEIKVSNQYYNYEAELNELFQIRVPAVIHIDGHQKTARFLFEQVIENCFVYRCFQICFECEDGPDNTYSCRVALPEEVQRYVFFKDVVILEKSDYTRSFISIDDIPYKDAYDTARDARGALKYNLQEAFKQEVILSHKDEIIKGFDFVRSDEPTYGLKSFCEIYKKANSTNVLPSNIPERILKELNTRSHKPNHILRLYKDLVVIVGERRCDGLTCKEQTRAYFDQTDSYFFARNALTKQWEPADYKILLRTFHFENPMLMDADLLENTCMNKYVKYSIEKKIPSGQKINVRDMIVQDEFLAAEQAAKMESPVFDVIVDYITDKREIDKEENISEVLGISGRQMKYLNDLTMPSDIKLFKKFMNDKGFMKAFPDVKKRMFAVCFYLNKSCMNYDIFTAFRSLSKAEVLAASQTICSIEKADHDKWDFLLTEYRDYLKMHSYYQNYVDHMTEEDPLRQQVEEFGEFPINIKPSKIRDYHYKICRIVDLMRVSGELYDYSEDISKRYQSERRKTEYSNGKYSILMPKDATEIVREGRELQHCVGNSGYIEKMAHKRCTILFLRNNAEPQKPLLTIEVCDELITQCYGFRDSINKDKNISEFIKDYAARNDLLIRAKILWKEE